MSPGRTEPEQRTQAPQAGEMETRRLLQELQVRQGGMEQQNEELRAALAQMEATNAVLRAKVAMYESAEERLQQFAAVVDNTSESILVVGQDGRLLMVNPAFSRCTGYSAAEILGQSLELLCAGHKDEGFYRKFIKKLRSKSRWQGELWVRRKNGETFPVWASISAVTDSQGRIASYACVFSDITAIKQAEAELSRLAYHDTLTGLANRLVFTTRLDNAIAHAKRHRHRVALLYLDLDRFKTVNDTLGHAYGDRMLQTVADRLARCIRAEDTVSRIGGDEFAIILAEVKRREDAASLAHKIIRTVEHPMQVYGEKLVTSTSIGIGIFPDDAVDAAGLLRAADTAMYAAKQSGRRNYHFYA